MKVKFVRNGRNWHNAQSGKDEEVMDVFIDNSKKPLTRGMCISVGIKAIGLKIKPGESAEYELRRLA